MNVRRCLVCGTALIGRTDKKFCSDHCRSIENNKKIHESERPILETNKILRRNRTILKSLCPVGMATVRKEILDTKGFNTSFFSSLFLTKKKQVYYFSYDYGFTPLIVNGVKKALIVNKQHYMNSWNPWQYVKENDSTMPQ
jgi:hypothetical protein